MFARLDLTEMDLAEMDFFDKSWIEVSFLWNVAHLKQKKLVDVLERIRPNTSFTWRALTYYLSLILCTTSNVLVVILD